MDGLVKHVSFFLPDMEFGGVERVTINLAAGLIARAFESISFW